MSAGKKPNRRLATTQDDKRETFMIRQFDLIPFNLNRMDVDSLDAQANRWELKSTTKVGGSFSTARDLGPSHFERWRMCYFLFGRAWNYDTGFEFEHYHMLAPIHMEPWYAKHEAKFAKEIAFCEGVIADLPHRSVEDHERIRKSMYDGMLLNDPQISAKYIRTHGIPVKHIHHDTLLEFADRFPIPNMTVTEVEVEGRIYKIKTPTA